MGLNESAKIEVLKAVCGIQTLPEKELLERLEELYLRGVKFGAEAASSENQMQVFEYWRDTAYGQAASFCAEIVRNHECVDCAEFDLTCVAEAVKAGFNQPKAG